MTISTEAITEEVKSNGQWVHAVQNEISRAIRGPEISDRPHARRSIPTAPINLLLSDQAHRTRLDVPTIAAAHGARQRTIKSSFWRSLRACLKGHVLAASRLVINWIMAIRIHVSVVSGKASKSLLNRRERLSQPKVRSTIQRHCSTRNPCVLRGRFTIERVRCKTVATQSTSFPA